MVDDETYTKYKAYKDKQRESVKGNQRLIYKIIFLDLLLIVLITLLTNGNLITLKAYKEGLKNARVEFEKRIKLYMMLFELKRWYRFN